MRTILRSVLVLSVLTVAACDEIAVANDPVALADLRASKSCIRAVEGQTGISGASLNTSLPIVEVNQYIVDVPNAKSWTCFTDDNGKALELIEFRAD